MSKLAKVGVVAGALVAVLIVGVVLLFMNMNGIVRRSTESVLSKVLAVDVTVAGAKVDARAGSVSLTGIVIGNPPGYKTDRAMFFDEIYVHADIASFRTDHPVIHLVKVVAPEITWERTLRSSNLDDLIANAEKAGGSEEEPKAEEPASESNLKIERIELQQSKLRVAVPATGTTANLVLTDIVINDVGGEKDRVSPAEAMTLVLKEVLKASAAAAGDIVGVVKGVAEDVSTEAKKIGDEVGEGMKDGVNELKKVGEGLGGLLKKKE